MANPSDEISLYNAMKFSIENKDKAARIGENGYRKCLKYFNPVSNGNQLEAFLLEKIK